MLTDQTIRRTIRRFLAALLVALGAVLIFMVTEAWVGALLVVLGILIELIGFALRNKSTK